VQNNLARLLARGLVLGSLGVALMMPQAAHADYGGQGPIKPWGVFIHLEAEGIATQEPQAMLEAFHGNLSTNPHDKCWAAVFESTDTATGYHNANENVAQTAGKTTISGSPAYIVQEPRYPGARH
jgi:hypothetical protein